MNKYLERIYQEFEKTKLIKETYHKQRIELMNSNNIRFLLRNHLIQNAIEQVEHGNSDEAKILLKLTGSYYLFI